MGLGITRGYFIRALSFGRKHGGFIKGSRDQRHLEVGDRSNCGRLADCRGSRHDIGISAVAIYRQYHGPAGGRFNSYRKYARPMDGCWLDTSQGFRVYCVDVDCW